MNSVVLIGRLVRDPETRFTPGGKTICNMRIAVDRSGDQQDDGTYGAGFFNVSCSDRTAELAAQYLVKGSQVAVSGSLRFHEWEAKDGGKRSSVEVWGFQLQFLDSKADREEREDGQQTTQGQQTTRPPVDDDIPF